jgi:hypothetical protein
MRTRHAVVVGAVLIAAGAGFAAAPAQTAQKAAAASMVVYKSPTCGCCGAWIEHATRS